MKRLGLVLFVALAACKKESPWNQFEGIEYRVPLGTNVSASDGSVLPGPGGLGGQPSGVRPHVTLSKAGPQGFYVELAREPSASTLDGTKYIYTANKTAQNMVGRTTTTGWELDYDGISPTGEPTGRAHLIHYDLAGKPFQCSWANSNCGDPATAEAICRSVRVSR